ncbi:biotin carboxylase N-terminal domain-containing protein [Sciscionella marina]|uniref:ATP-binding protein n=1 Tax=Sciscionella marina TaxID=508770 RepID=UPI00038232AB|nr:biotin carboxylase N-terminal domain-containing protein [Sciscionella marina]
MFETVLIANRGEIAVRIAKTLRRMGIRSVAVYSDADADARHVRAADSAVRIGPAEAARSYLSIPGILEAARASGAQAIHPGYGFLSENTEFAATCAREGIVFIGPPSSAIEAMGDKIRAKQTVTAAGVPVVPGRTESGMSDAELIEAAAEVGFPVLLKPSAGGGGKGMRQVTEAGELPEAIASARREAAAAFGDDTLLIERFVRNPRHIEIQVLADSLGNTIHLGERECSLQRRHQKIVEECPSVLLDAATRERMGAAAVDAAAAVGYVGAGTVEFIVSGDRPEEFFFMEMNTRLQVEHPVTELVTGVDLVEQQLRAAAGLPLSVTEPVFDGHAVEVRVYAETVSELGFLPSGGTVHALAEPAQVRVDSGIERGDSVTSHYDPMLAKYIAHAPSRDEAIGKLRTALGETVLLGVPNNIAFLRALLADPQVRAGELDTGLVERNLERYLETEPPEHVLVAAAMERALWQEANAGTDPWATPGGWRIGEHAWTRWQLAVPGGEPLAIALRGRAGRAEVAIGEAEPVTASARRAEGALVVEFAGVRRVYAEARTGDSLWLAHEGACWQLTEIERLAANRKEAGARGGPVVSPMPGTVLLVKAALGETVRAGAPIAVVEAMKMEHTITSGVHGVVTELPAEVGKSVALGEVLAVIEVS